MIKHGPMVRQGAFSPSVPGAERTSGRPVVGDTPGVSIVRS